MILLLLKDEKYQHIVETDDEKEVERKVFVNVAIMRAKKTYISRLTHMEKVWWNLYLSYSMPKKDEDDDGYVNKLDICRSKQTADFFLKFFDEINHKKRNVLTWQQCKHFLQRHLRKAGLKKETVLKRLTQFTEEGWIKKIKQIRGRDPPLYALNMTHEQCFLVIKKIKEKYGGDYVGTFNYKKTNNEEK